MNENYAHPEMPDGAEADIIKGMYLLRDGDAPLPAGSPTAAAKADRPGRSAVPETDGPPPRETRAEAGTTVGHGATGARAGTAAKSRKERAPRVQLLGSGTILREVIAAAELLEKEFGVASDIWSCPSFTELRRDGFDVERWNRLHPSTRRATRT